jgi:hypothetical protein
MPLLTEQEGASAAVVADPAPTDTAVVAAAVVPCATATVLAADPPAASAAEALAVAAKPNCPMCKGTGKCPRCDGTGEDEGANCAKCDGDGECPKCDGSGNQQAAITASAGAAGAATKVTATAAGRDSEVFAADAQVVPSTANADAGTIDVVWYSGAMVPRIDRSTGEPYMLRLAMEGCRMDRLNSGAPVFDTHFTGDDFKSLMAGKVGTRAQVGVVQRAWPNGNKGMATLKFDLGDPDGADMFRKASTGILQNLSFGTFIYEREKTDMQAEGMAGGKAPSLNNQQVDMFKATDWEPFEISPCTVPADFNSCFLSAQPNGEMAVFGAPDAAAMDAIRAISPLKEKAAMAETTQQGTGAADAARVLNEQALTAAREEAVIAERLRVSEITSMGVTAGKHGVDQAVISDCIAKGVSVDQARKDVFAALDAKGKTAADGTVIKIRTEVGTAGGADLVQKRLECMQASMLLRADSRFFLNRHPVTGEFLAGCGEKQNADALDMAREYRNFKLIDMAKEYLQLRGIEPRGWDSTRIAEVALHAPARDAEFFDGGGAESTTDFPAILANVANKTLRQGYESYPRTFEPFSRQMTAKDFKPVNRVMLSDAPSLQQLNEKGEYHRAQLTDSNIVYALNTFGEIVALTRKVIINDDLQAFTRVPALLGVAAARLESDIVWNIIINNPVAKYAGDAAATALFAAGHNNLLTGTASSIDPTVAGALALGALGLGRGELRRQKGIQGTPLNLTPRFIAVPTTLETYMLQVVFPIDIASSDATKVVPQWVRSLVPIVEPRLDAASATAWYLFADPAQIDTVEYCYLEGQQGVYIETKQGFEVDGIEIKARMDFGAAAIDYRGMQKNAGV